MRDRGSGVAQVMGLLDSLDFTSTLARHMAGNMLWAYLLLAMTTAPPLVPNSALLVTGGVMAAHGQLDIGLVLVVVAGSALTGDLVIHRTGRVVSGPILTRLSRRPRRRALLDWAANRIQQYGVPFVVGCRFLPSGRLIGGLAAGIVRYPTRCYMLGAGIAEVVWATYSVGIGYLGGRATGDSVYAIGLGLGVSMGVAGIGGLVQFAAGRRARAAAPPGGSVAVRVHHAGLAAPDVPVGAVPTITIPSPGRSAAPSANASGVRPAEVPPMPGPLSGKAHGKTTDKAVAKVPRKPPAARRPRVTPAGPVAGSTDVPGSGGDPGLRA